MILLCGTWLTELVKLTLEGEWNTIQCQCRFHRACPMQHCELIEGCLPLCKLKGNFVAAVDSLRNVRTNRRNRWRGCIKECPTDRCRFVTLNALHCSKICRLPQSP